VRAQIAAVPIALALALGACATATGPTPYPADWASIKSTPTADGCPNLAGNYGNQSVATVPSALVNPPTLSEVFTRLVQGKTVLGDKPPWPTIPSDAVAMSIEQTPELLSLHFAAPAGERTTLAFRRYHFNWSEKVYGDLFHCTLAADEPRLRFFAEPQSHGSSSQIHVEGGGTLVFLMKATDGSLIVQWRSEDFLLWLGVLGSHFKFDSIWHRYPPIGGSMPSPR
jgi:hypothetical protein